MLSHQSAATPATWQHVDISVGAERYPYWYGHDCMDAVAEYLHAMNADRFLVVSDDNVLALHGDELLPRLAAVAPTHVLRGAAGERLKSMSALAGHAETAVAVGATRQTVVVAFGGGTVGNLAGLLAAILFRGIRLVHVPTTLVAAMDSVISLKQAINSSRGKNHFGVYHRPSAVLTDVRLLQTLPARERRSGLCEAIKSCLAIRPMAIQRLRSIVIDTDADDPAALIWLLGESVTAKTTVMRKDAHERQTGLVLEYGHTIGHAIELHDHNARGADGVSHGEAVGLGMIAAARLSLHRGWLSAEETSLHASLLQAIGAPTVVPSHLDVEQLTTTLLHDNKRGCIASPPGEAPMVLLRRLGEPAGSGTLPLVNVPLYEIRQVLAAMAGGVDRGRQSDTGLPRLVFDAHPSCRRGGDALNHADLPVGPVRC